MNRTIFVILLLALSQTIALSQARIDVIYLKNGDILKGEIIENVPNDYVKIELPGGSLFTVKYVDILKFTKEKPSPEVQTQQQSRQGESNGQPNSQTMMYYEREKKSSGTAVALSLLMTSTGHAYAGNWGRGLLFTAARVGGGLLALTAGIQTKTHNDYKGYGIYYTYETTEITPFYYIGLGASLVFAIWEALDASAEADRYNENLYNKMIGKRPFGLKIVPSKNGTQLQLSYSF